MCKKRTAVSHSSAKAELISLHEGLRMEGTPALPFWDGVSLKFLMLRETFIQRLSGNRHSLAHDVDLLSSDMIDHVSPNISRAFIPSPAFRLWRQRGGHSHDYTRKKPKFETRFSHSPC